MSAAAKTPMVLPPAERPTGIVRGGLSYSFDDRVPNRLPSPPESWDWEAQEPRHVGWDIGRLDERGAWQRTCPDGRHLFDVIESTVQHLSYDQDDDEIVETDFRARLTCVQCGVVLAWEGRRTVEERIAILDPAPMVAGDLVAQMVKADRIGSTNWSRYDVYRRTGDAVERVGRLSPGRGSRGRHFYYGQLDAWGTGPGTYVEGKDPLAALRAIARRLRTEQVAP
jgi:hypothetical protein